MMVWRKPNRLCGVWVWLLIFQLPLTLCAWQPGFVGCYKTRHSVVGVYHWILGFELIENPAMSWSWCMHECVDERGGGWEYIGLKNGNECFCGPSGVDYERYGSGSDCDKRCKGNSSEYCGGEHQIAVYRIPDAVCSPPTPSHGSYVVNATPSYAYYLENYKYDGTRLRFTCHRGYFFPSNSLTTTCSSGHWSPASDCSECTAISHCVAGQLHCTTASNQQCDHCDGDFDIHGAAYKAVNNRRECRKQCSWRTDSNACYPGNCTDAQCTCSSGFSGPDCRTMSSSQAPVLSEYRATLVKGTTKTESPRVQNSAATVYTNVRDFENITINWKSSYKRDDLPSYSAGGHPYIKSVGLGVVEATVNAVVYRGASTVYQIASSQACSTAGGEYFSMASPATTLVVCEFAYNLNYNLWTPATGDVLRYDVASTSGGYLSLYNRDSSDTIITRYYSGYTVSMSSNFTFDFDDPYHCVSVNSGCRTTMLNAGDDVTTQAYITITWQGWEDNPAGIKEYDLEVRQLSGTHGAEMTEIVDSPAVFFGVTSSGQMVSLPHAGVFSIVLTAVDNADNVKLTRRFVFFDDDPNHVTLQSNASVRVLTATEETNYEWLTDLDFEAGTTSVVVDWTDRFINIHHLSQGLLKPIGSYVATIEDDYDQNFGKRGRAAVPNALGVTEFRVIYDMDHNGGRTTVNSGKWSSEATNTQATFDLPLVDGDSIQFWVEARDLAGHFVRDSVLVHADSSPPVIEEFWLTRDGEVNLAIHNSADLHEMSVAFRTYDIHSGILTIHWRLWDPITETAYGSQTIPARRINPDTEDCDPVSCMCIPVGDCYVVDYSFNPTFHIGTHDTDYFITLTVTNHARLITTETIRVTVDTSGPQSGVVHDGIRGSNEIDFQEGSDLSAHWEGFFDQESGVKFYYYLFDESCWTDESSVARVKDEMTRTTSTHASWTAPSPGRYFVTVIAYNRALEPSEVVCSDGVVIDVSPPDLSQIAIGYVRMWPGLAKDVEGRVWFINEHREKAELTDVSSGCSNKAVLVEDLSVYPEMSGNNDTSANLQGDLDCLWISAIQEKFFLPTDKHLSMSWFGEDAESSIYDYQVGYSSSLLINFFSSVSTSGHNHFVLYHPHISHGSVLYLTVNAINSAQLSTSKVIGPITVDTTPPMFVGRVSVNVEDDYLIADWGESGFIDDEDTTMRYQVAIGSTPGGTETLSFQDEKGYRNGWCSSQTHCAAFSLADLDWHLHGNHEYYVSVRAQNGAGLATIGTSSVYRHIVQLPSLGVVLDVAPPVEEAHVEFGIAKDIDVQMNTTSISARWFGFEHPHLDINYEIAIGSEPGNSDVSHGYIDVGNLTFYRLDRLHLTSPMTYYVTVRATSETGSVNVTSDGIKVIPEGQVLEGSVIKDGLGCDQEEMSLSSGFSHHSSAADQPCQDDITYQSSTSDTSARWTIPEMLQPFVTSVLWAVEQEIEVYLDDEMTTKEWVTLLDDQDLGMAFQHVQAGSGLQSGAHYRSKVTFCHVSVCFQPIVSDGFWVLSQPPEVGQVTVGDVGTAEGKTEMRVVFQPFAHEYVQHDDPQELMEFYEWSIAEDGDSGATLSPWRRVSDFVITEDGIGFTAYYSGPFDLDVCLKLSIRGYNKAGLSSVASSEIVDCEDASLVIPHIVIDADHEVQLEQNARWPEADKNYISSTSSLSAVWPTLRHRAYTWAVILDTGSSAFGNLDEGLHYPCDHPRAKACGDTDQEFVNVPGLLLEHGMRYRICIHADEVTLEHELWNEPLPAVSSCSDGVVIDTTPPTPGSVWIGWDQHQLYQSSSSELVLHWESFTDIEEHGMARHHSGIKYYEYAIGSMRGGSDVKDFTRVGITNSVIVHNLRLQNGHEYYAVVRATDFVGLSSQAVSDVIVIDTSPPVISADHTLDIGGSFIRSTASISASWENVFSDKESGVAYYEWAVGSHPGHADIMPFTRESTEIGISDPSRPLPLQEGHSYFISLKAINTVGLLTLTSYGAVTVDGSPPLPGHVFDGNPANVSSSKCLRDRDFQEERTVIRAFWEGFHDPHSAIVGYTWTAGTCSGCSDVVPEQHVGLDTYVIAENLNLVPGLIYYVRVTACNAADLCSSVTSDGVMVDDSPPVAGRVYDGGPGGGDISYQSSRLELRAHWWGFHDPHSGLSHYEWRAGTSPGADDILPSTRIQLSEDALIFLSESDQMPIGTDIYITVRAYNPLGMWSQATSNGFRVDSSPPDVLVAPAVDPTLGMAIQNALVLQDLIRFSWEFSDPESGIKDQFVSVGTHQNGDVNIRPIKISGSELDHSFTNLTLHEGSRYVITVVACNFAGLCSQAETEPLLVDGSPPSIGTFAIDTESAADLDRRGSMTWAEDPTTSLGSLALAWLGFADVHSGISNYFISVGRTYGGSELTPSGPVQVNHSHDGMSLDEGIVQATMVPLEDSLVNLDQPYLYVSIWAVNGVGLPSNSYHSAFELSQSSSMEGALVLLRQCPPATCEGHCACAPIDKACTPDRRCNDVTDSNPNTEIEVLDVLDLMHIDNNTVIDINDTATQHMAAAVWRATEQKGMDIKWFEWSIGDDSSVNPSGVFDAATERVWFDIGKENSVIITLNEDRKLSKGVKYHVFIRAWYDATTYAVFKSDGITPDITPPRISTVRGTKVKDLASSDAREDTDYLTDPNTIFISWEGVFLDEALSQYQVSLSTYPGGEDIRQFGDHVLPVSLSSTQFTRINLQSGQRYYTNIRAFNKAGLHALISSDGFVADTRMPDTGLVFDGLVVHDVEYQNSSVVISASWHGFVDLESYIDHYEWCVGLTPGPEDDGILPCADVGLHLSASKTLAEPLTDGLRYFSKISAVDAAGLQSESVSSDGFVVDTTPPKPLEHIHLGENLIQNPSFEMMLQDLVPTDMHDITTVPPENGTFNETMIRPTKSPNIHSTLEAPTPLVTESLTANFTEVNVTESDPTSDTNLTTEAPPFTTGMPSTARMDVIPDEPLGEWIVASDSQISEVTSDKTIAQDGRKFLSLHGSISQSFNTTLGSHYQVVLFASHIVPSHNPLLNQEGRVKASGLDRVFRLYDRPAHAHSDQSLGSIRWHQHRFYFTASDDVSTLTISSVGESNGIMLDNIQVRPVTTGLSSGNGSVEVHTQFVHSWSSIQAKWHFIDAESPVVDYSWAIGTTMGGTQLQSFTSVGTQTDAINIALNMAHGSYVYITVMARNSAELVSVATSDPILIDLTPPLIYFVNDGGDTQDVDFSANDSSLTFRWSASDPESGIDHCEWAVGSKPGLDDILPRSLSTEDTSTVTTNLSHAMVEGQQLYASVTCYNHAEKSSWKSSDGITIVTVPPSSSSAVVNVKTVSETQYETRDGYQSQRDSLKGSWDGFVDPFGIQSYECHLSGPDAIPSSWKPCGSTSETHLHWSGLSLEDDGTYSLSVRAISHAGLTSQAIVGNFTVQSSEPAYRASSLLRSSWLGNGTVDLTWAGLFSSSSSSSSSSSLVYEVSLGSIPGGSDILQWVETMEAGMRVSPLVPYTDYHLTLTAINAAGLSQTLNKVINSES